MSAQSERDYFWRCFDNYLLRKGNPFFITHTKNGVNQAAGNINNQSPMAQQTICCEFKYLEHVILVQVYINHKINLYNYLFDKKDEIESRLGYKVEWVNSGKISESVRRIQKKFPIDKPFEKMIEEVFPYILDFIRVFSPYLNN